MANWFNTKEIGFIWHGEWADPELEFKGNVVNYYDVEQYCCDCMKEENLDYNNDDLFAKWVREHESEIQEWILEIAPQEVEED